MLSKMRPSLRRHEPVQVQGSPRPGVGGLSAPCGGAPLGQLEGWGRRGRGVKLVGWAVVRQFEFRRVEDGALGTSEPDSP